jgi:hypothetical protein
MPRVTRADLGVVFKAPKVLLAAEEVINGAIVAGPVETGTATPTLGANKPGTFSGPPEAWLVFVHEGVEYVSPLWRRDT